MITSGFFNSDNGDRKYDAEQMSSLFAGVFTNGVFANIGGAFKVEPTTVDNLVTIDSGKGWFMNRWIKSDSKMQMTLDSSHSVLHRYDAIVVEMDLRNNGRQGGIKVVKGTNVNIDSIAPYPTMTVSSDYGQFPIAYIHRPANNNSIKQSYITNLIGSELCPYLIGPASLSKDVVDINKRLNDLAEGKGIATYLMDSTGEFILDSTGDSIGGKSQVINVVDSVLSETSTNPIQNRVITKEISELKTLIQSLGPSSTTTNNIINTNIDDTISVLDHSVLVDVTIK